MTRRRVARLYGDPELRVLWLVKGASELALSADGIWVRNGRRRADLPWTDIDQLQLRPMLGKGKSRLDVFLGDGPAHAVGPFPSAQAQRWLRACALAAADAGLAVLPLEGVDGFALRSRAGSPPPAGGTAG